MVSRDRKLLENLSTTDLKRLLAARERIDVLEKERAQLSAALAKVEQELENLIAAATGSAGAAGGKKTARKGARKKPARRKATARKTAGRAAKKTTRKKTTKKTTKKIAKKTAKKTAKKKAATGAASRTTLEDVIVQVLRKARGPVAYKDLYAKIVDGNLFRSKSKNFDNVMRRTLSTSDKVKRVSRGVYALA